MGPAYWYIQSPHTHDSLWLVQISNLHLCDCYSLLNQIIEHMQSTLDLKIENFSNLEDLKSRVKMNDLMGVIYVTSLIIPWSVHHPFPMIGMHSCGRHEGCYKNFCLLSIDMLQFVKGPQGCKPFTGVWDEIRVWCGLYVGQISISQIIQLFLLLLWRYYSSINANPIQWWMMIGSMSNWVVSIFKDMCLYLGWDLSWWALLYWIETGIALWKCP